MARVLLENVTKIFDGKITAISDATLEASDKEFMVIVGPSGCGKTTILRMIAGLEEATFGTITIGDKIVNEIPPRARDVAMVFQNYALYPHMTTFQNMAFGLKLRKYPKEEIKKRVVEAATLLGITELLDRKPGALSGGQRQRVAVGRAIVRSPKVFLFDEPLSNLDAGVRLTTRTELKALHKKLKATSIYVTHDQAEAMTLGDRLCVLYNGSIQQIASPLEVYNQPANRFIASFIGSPPMNFFSGLIQYRDDEVYFVTTDDLIQLPSRLKDTLTSYRNQRMVLGIRPEHILLHPVNRQDQNGIDCSVAMVEQLGDRIDVYLKSGSNDRLIAKADHDADFHTGQPITIYIDVEKAHIFELGEIGKNAVLGT